MKILKLDRNQLIKKFEIPAYSFTPGCLIMPTLYFDNDTNLFFVLRTRLHWRCLMTTGCLYIIFYFISFSYQNFFSFFFFLFCWSVFIACFNHHLQAKRRKKNVLFLMVCLQQLLHYLYNIIYRLLYAYSLT